MLGRARRRTLVVDAGGQSNRSAEGIGGLLGRDGRPPAKFYAAERAESLRDAGVAVDERRVAELRGPHSSLTAVVFADGDELPGHGLLVPVTLYQRSALARWPRARALRR